MTYMTAHAKQAKQNICGMVRFPLRLLDPARSLLMPSPKVLLCMGVLSKGSVGVTKWAHDDLRQ